MSPLLIQLNWPNHLLIIFGCESDVEREFYMRVCIREGCSKRKLEGQII
ncbi:MAG: DUF1016 N-terminal domain-containing protein [Marvinbryantia sp.]